VGSYQQHNECFVSVKGKFCLRDRLLTSPKEQFVMFITSANLYWSITTVSS